MQPVEVVARFDAQGRLTPLSFTWRGQTFPVESTGRRWQDERGEHILAMIPVERVCELLFTPLEQRWYVRFFSPGMNVA
jgi:hypothetical protein